MLNRGAFPPVTVPSPAAASPTAGVDAKTLDQLLGLYLQNMSQPRQTRQLPAMRMARPAPQPTAFQNMQQYR